MSNQKVRSVGSTYLFSFVVSGFAALAICAMTPIRPMPPLPQRTLPKSASRPLKDPKGPANQVVDRESDPLDTSQT